MKRFHGLTASMIVLIGISGCNPQSTTENYANPSAMPKVGEGDDHEGHGPALELGSSAAGDWTVRASRDESAIFAGGEAPVDVWVTGGTGNVKAVRFWIGVEDAAGSVKALAAIENASDPTHWHTHVEVPQPLPEGSKLWVEVESEAGVQSIASFDLKM